MGQNDIPMHTDVVSSTAVLENESNSPWSGSLTKNLLAAYRRLWEAPALGANYQGNVRLYRREGAPPTNIKYFRYADTVQFHFHVEND